MFFALGKKVLHLLLGLGFIGQMVGMGLVQYGQLEKRDIGEIFFYHKSMGLLLLLFSLGFLYCAYRYAPGLSSGLKKWEEILAKVVHKSLYFCILSMPLSGVLMSIFAGKAIPFFGLWTVPIFLAKIPLLAKAFHFLHHTSAYLLYIALPLHIAGTIKHAIEGQKQHLKIFKFF